MTGRQWDDGAIRNQTELRALLGPDVLLGANGLGSACGFGNVYEGSVAGADCTAGDVTAWEGYGSPFYMYDPANFDSAITQFGRWMNARPGGRAKYGFITEYGTCGTNNLGHPLTAKDERMGLALATIGGVDLWAVHDCDWGTTVVPGGQFSIPEMGDNATYPRGWLGQPTSDPTRIASGQWKRTFTGGVVYANATGATVERRRCLGSRPQCTIREGLGLADCGTPAVHACERSVPASTARSQSRRRLLRHNRQRKQSAVEKTTGYRSVQTDEEHSCESPHRLLTSGIEAGRSSGE